MTKLRLATPNTPQGPWPIAPGEMATLIRNHDWIQTPLGDIVDWPRHLKNTVDLILQSPVPMVTLWGEKGIMIYNDAYSYFAGSRHPTLLGSPVLEGWIEVADFNRRIMDVVMKGGTLTFKDQHLILYRDGRSAEAWLDLYYSPVLDDHGKPNAVLAVVIETTARVQLEYRRQEMEHALRESEDRYRRTLEASELIGTWDWDIVMDRVICDPRFAAFYQVDPKCAMTGAPSDAFFDSVHPDDLPAVKEATRRAIEERKDFSAEHRIIQKDGSARWVIGRGRCEYNAQGKPVRLSGAIIEITERKQLEAILDGQRRALELTIHGAPLNAVLEAIVKTMETQSTRKIISTILLLSKDGKHLHHGAAPGFSAQYREEVEGVAIGPGVGSCGTAAFTQREVIVEDVMTDPLWQDFRHLATRENFRGSWSTPIFSSQGKLLGTMAIYYPQPAVPTTHERNVAKLLSDTAALVIERYKNT